LFCRSEHECVDREGFIRELGSLVMEARGQQLTLERWVNWLGTSVAEQEPRAEEPKLRIAAPAAAPAPFCLPKACRNFIEKIMVA
jgi:hypothetical protein